MQVNRPPRGGQTEEDLLREARQFEERNRGGATSSSSASSSSIRPDSLVKSQQPKGSHGSRRTEEASALPSSSSSSVVEAKVVERIPILCTLPTPHRLPFPEVFATSLVDSAEKGEEKDGRTTKKKKSLFARSMGAKIGGATRQDRKDDVHAATTKVDCGPRSLMLDGSSLLDSRDVFAIHEENVARLQAMTREDREALIAEISPETIAFLRSRKRLVAKVEESMEEGEEEKDEEMMATTTSSAPLETAAPPEMTSKNVKFVNMDRPEPEKTRWTGELPPLSEGNNTLLSGFSARFDFQGDLLSFSEQIPTTAGLHHHGEEQERAGYSVNELLILARSTNVQQRVIALNTLAKMVKKFKEGTFDAILEQNLLSELLDNDLLLILRTSLDENSETLREATCYCLRQLLDNQLDELLLDLGYVTSSRGHVQPSLPTSIVAEKEAREEYARERDQLSDADVFKLDAVVGLLRTDILQRFSFMLSSNAKKTLTSSCLFNVVCVTIRIARHSLQSASEVIHHESLMASIYSYLNKSSSSADAVTKVTAALLKLLRILSAWSRSFANLILSQCNLPSLLPRLVTLESGSVALASEAFRVWDTLLRYGLLTGLFLDLFPVVVKYFQVIRAQVDVTKQHQASSKEGMFCHAEVAAALFKCVEGVFHCQEQGVGGLEWRHLRDLHGMLEDILNHVTRNDDLLQNARMLTACLNTFSASLLSMAREEEVTYAVERCSSIFSSLAVPFLKSKVMSSLIEDCVTKSGLLSGVKDGRERDPKNLPSCGAMALEDHQVAAAASLSPQDRSVFPLLSATANFLLALLHVNKGLQPSGAMVQWISQLLPFVNAFANEGSSSRLWSNWFINDEIVFLHRLLMVEDHIDDAVEEDVLWALGNALLASLQTRHRDCAVKLFYKITKQIRPSSVSRKLQHLDLRDGGGEAAAAATDEALGNLLSIQELYKSMFPNVDLPMISQLETLTERNNGEALLPGDWKYLPVLSVFNASTTTTSKAVYECQEDDVRKVRLCLQWVYLGLVHQSAGLEDFEASVQYSRLATTFLASASLFLDPTVNKFLALCFTELAKDKKKKKRKKMTFTKAVPGIDSFKDFYRSLVEQYYSVSFCDLTFSVAILIPTAHNAELRSIFWMDNAENLQTFRVKEGDLPPSLSASQFVIGDEKPHILSAYMKAVLGGTVTRMRNPLLFHIASGNIVQAARSSNADVVSRARDLLLQLGINIEV